MTQADRCGAGKSRRPPGPACRTSGCVLPEEATGLEPTGAAGRVNGSGLRSFSIPLYGKPSKNYQPPCPENEAPRAPPVFADEKVAFCAIFVLRIRPVLIRRRPPHAPFVYRLGRQVFILERGVRLP